MRASMHERMHACTHARTHTHTRTHARTHAVIVATTTMILSSRAVRCITHAGYGSSPVLSFTPCFSSVAWGS